MSKRVIFCLFLVASLLFSNCAIIDQNVALLYDPSEQCALDLPDVFLVRVKEFPPLERVGEQIVVGRVVNATGRAKAKILTGDSVTDWTATGLIDEYEKCSSSITPVEQVSPFGLSVMITIERVFVVTGNGFIDGTVSLYQNGELIREEKIHSTSLENTVRLNMAEGEAIALKNAMRGFIHNVLAVLAEVVA